MSKLTGKQVRFLRGLGHHLQPSVMVGKDELSSGLIASVEEALDCHELIKVRVQEGCMLDRKEVADQLSQITGAQVAQILGRTMLLYRATPEKLISLP